MSTHRPPLILGATGRLGRAFRALWADGRWPSFLEPVWHGRAPASGLGYIWDMTGPAPALPPVHGVICLAGVTTGDEAVLSENTRLARAALDLARSHDLGPVILMSSAAVYGRATGPQSETADPIPANAYGTAKLAMERAAKGACCLRLANVAGSDALFDNMAQGPVTLDRFEDGSYPARAYIGPLTLADVLLGLLASEDALPTVLNVAQPGTVAMDAILTAAKVPFTPRPAPPTALREVALDSTRLSALHALPRASATALVAEARAAGWQPAS